MSWDLSIIQPRQPSGCPLPCISRIARRSNQLAPDYMSTLYTGDQVSRTRVATSKNVVINRTGTRVAASFRLAVAV